MLRLGILGLTVLAPGQTGISLQGKEWISGILLKNIKSTDIFINWPAKCNICKLKNQRNILWNVNEIAAAVEEQDQLLADSEASQIVPKKCNCIMNESLTDFEEFEKF